MSRKGGSTWVKANETGKVEGRKQGRKRGQKEGAGLFAFIAVIGTVAGYLLGKKK
ncbi:MAG: hypothetical protein Q4G16_11070 [Cruoricaptor ignavus]|nr:hypothetical protein [Cruoricaptor ignavus]